MFLSDFGLFLEFNCAPTRLPRGSQVSVPPLFQPKNTFQVLVYSGIVLGIDRYSTAWASPLVIPQQTVYFIKFKMHQNNVKFRILHGFGTVSEPFVLTGRVDFLIFGMCYLITCGGSVDAETPSGALLWRRYRGYSLPTPYLCTPTSGGLQIRCR